MKKTIKSLALIALSLIFGAVGTAQAQPFTAQMMSDTYNGNLPNGTPTPQQTPGLGLDLFDAANLLNPQFAFTKNENLDKMPDLSQRLVSEDAAFAVNGSVVSLYILGRSAKRIDTIGWYQRSADGSTIIKHKLLGGITGFGMYGNGSSSSPFMGVEFTLPSYANVIGFYIDAQHWSDPTNVTTFYSESKFSDDGFDHLISYTLPEVKNLTYTIQDHSTGDIFTHTFTDNAILVGLEDKLGAIYQTQYGYTLGDEDYNDLMFVVDFANVQPTDKPPLVPEPATFVLVGSGLAGLWVMSRRKRS